MLDLDPGMMIWAWITFVVLLILMHRFAWKPILSTIDKREKTIQDSLDKAQDARQEAEQLLVKHQDMMRSAEEEARNLINENKALAEKSRQEIMEEARNSAQLLIDKAKTEIEKEKESALLALREEVADLALSATRKIIGESLDEARHRSLVDDYIDRLSKETKN